MIYGINHELMASGVGEDHAYREYGTDYYEELCYQERFEREVERDERQWDEERQMWDAIVKNESDSMYNPDKGQPDYNYELPLDDLDSF